MRALNLVIIDDDASIVRLLKQFLSAEIDGEIKIEGFTDPQQARNWIESRCCDLVMTDIEMPGATGLEILRWAKARNAWTQVVLLTAHSTCEHIAEAIEAGATDYLLKPVRRDEVRLVVNECCRRIYRWHDALRGTLAETP